MGEIVRQIYVNGKWIDERRVEDKEVEKNRRIFNRMLKEELNKTDNSNNKLVLTGVEKCKSVF